MPSTVNRSQMNNKPGLKKQVDVEFGQLAHHKDLEMPGYLPVLISDESLSGEGIKFFGVEKQGKTISGEGVEAEVVEDGEGIKIAYFNMEELVQSGQYTENTVEGIIKVRGEELGRKLVNSDSATYLG